MYVFVYKKLTFNIVPCIKYLIWLRFKFQTIAVAVEYQFILKIGKLV